MYNSCMLNLILVLLMPIFLSVASAKTIQLKPFDFENVTLLDRASLYLTNSSIKTIKTTRLAYKFILIPANSVEPNRLIDKLSSFANLNDTYRIPEESDSNYFDITSLVKKTMLQVDLNSAQIINSYNCHNLTLLIAGFQKRQTYTSETEINFYLNNFCNEINSPVKRSISIYNHPMLSHSVTSIDKNLYIEKFSNHISKFPSIKKGSVDGLKHYQCNSNLFTMLKCDKLETMRKQIDKVDIYFSKLAVSLAGARRIDSEFEKIKVIMSKLARTSFETRNCNLVKKSIQERIESLSSLYEDLKGGNLYGRGSYGGSGPKI